jgi:hypothetical protein
MSIKDLTKDASALEKLNMEMHSQYKQKDKDLSIEEADKESFSKKNFLSEEVKATLESRDDILKKADDIFGKGKSESPFKSTSMSSRESYSSSSSSSSSSRGYSSSGYGRYGYSSDSRRDNIEERVSKMMSKSQEIAEEMMEDPAYIRSRRRRRGKRNGLMEKIAPKNSARRKALIIGGVIAIEGVVTALLYAQRRAKDEILRKREEQ